MAKRVTHELTYDAPLADVRAMLLDEAFRRSVAAEQRALRSTVSVTGDVVRFETVQPAAGIPSFAKKFVGDEIVVVQDEKWGATAADIHVTIPGKPGDMTGTATLRETGTGTTETVDLQVKVSIPLVGGKIEGLIADLLVKALKAENRAGRAWLAKG
ncbi:DUF2505 domain-containing protein [Nocardioides sp. ChNu-153]|uniref:DUF2505 domain-containing protein n=1 Tax=unclassified Nocardioides TaxID=2615069 RepID=UPI0024050AFA|nr:MULTISPECIES: DUF2505 domain-containing protein [unclassified Nocardioides]MDF9717132.1 DUF2505 domain-containing protein [Nocardioides sp. ChNu-99]MDN7122697.1 DUF2505 domain-containing protein [Nocardioides sp. ChNu-153]